MRFVPVFALLAPWLLFEPLIHPMRMGKSVIGIAAALLCLAITPLAIGAPKMRPALSVIGGVLAVSNFFIPDSLSVMASHVASGAILILIGSAPAPFSTYTREGEGPGPVTSTARALMHEPQSDPA